MKPKELCHEVCLKDADAPCPKYGWIMHPDSEVGNCVVKK
jgi:hypothetical protein